MCVLGSVPRTFANRSCFATRGKPRKPSGLWTAWGPKSNMYLGFRAYGLGSCVMIATCFLNFIILSEGHEHKARILDRIAMRSQ